MDKTKAPTFTLGVSVVMPCFNEAEHVFGTLVSVTKALSKIECENVEIIVVDCDSDDASLETLHSVESKFPLRVISIKARNTAKALNVGFELAQFSIRARCDFHSQYPETYFVSLLEVLKYEKNIGFVGYPVTTVPGADTKTAEAIALALSSKVGVGNSTFRVAKYKQNQKILVEADTAPFGCWRASDQLFLFGDFNETLLKNQDDEFCARVIAAGKQVALVVGRGYVTYLGRTSFKSLATMFFNYGLFKPASRRYKLSGFRARHFVPAAFVMVNLVALAQAPFVFVSAPFILLAIYIFIVQACAPMRLKIQFTTSIFLMHTSYGLGFLWGWIIPSSLLKGQSVVNSSR